MGFWQGLGRMISGEPVFQPGDAGKEAHAVEEHRDRWQDSILPDENQSRPSDDVAQDVKPQDDQATTGDHYTASGEKIIPEVSVRHCKTHDHGDDIDLWIVIANNSAVEVMVDKITMLGTTTELNRFMKPGEEREFMVYRGDKIKNDNYTKAQIYYRAQATGDYFCADLQIIYQAQSDGDYQVDELRLIRPIHDV